MFVSSTLVKHFRFFVFRIPKNACRFSSSMSGKKYYQLVVVGGGAGGITMAAKFANKLGKGKVVVVEPEKDHYYQPLWTLVGSGLKSLDESRRNMQNLIPSNADWIQEKVVNFDPIRNSITTNKGSEIKYDFLIVAVGLKLDFGKIIGLQDALQTPGVCSNYSHETVLKTQQALKDFKNGNAIFTQPNVPIKCAGAPQKAMYLAEAYFQKTGKRRNANIIFNTGLGSIFSAPVYAESLKKVMQTRGIKANVNHNLIEIKPNSKEAIFEIVNQREPKKTETFKYEMIHVTPPMGTPKELKESCLVNKDGFLTVDKGTLQHTSYPNIFGIGDCTNLPTSKTAAAIASQSGVLRKNLSAAMNGQALNSQYDGYTSCPLITSFNRCILAEFDYTLKPLETLPVDQSKERWTSYLVKKHLLAPIYWNLMLKGYWEGPSMVRKILHAFGSSK